MNATNESVAASHVRRIVGPTILLGDGSYFDYENPAATTMSIEDYAYGLAYTCRFRGQTRARIWRNRRVFYSVAQHCVLLARALRADGYPPDDCLAGLMHESGEVPWGDFPGPAKVLLPEFRPLEKGAEEAINAHFGVVTPVPELIKRYDLRMLATEKRDLMPQHGNDWWEHTQGYEPFDFVIEPYGHPDFAAEAFLRLWFELSA